MNAVSRREMNVVSRSFHENLPYQIFNDLEFLLGDFGFKIQKNGHSDQVSPHIRIMWSHMSVLEFTFYDGVEWMTSYGIDSGMKYYTESSSGKKFCSKEHWFNKINRYLANEYLKKNR